MGLPGILLRANIGRSDRTFAPGCGSSVEDYKEPIEVHKARLEDVPGIVKMLELAFEDDPLHDYTRNTPDAKPPGKIALKVGRKLIELCYALYLLNKIDLAVEHDKAQIIASRAPKSLNRREKIVQNVVLSIQTFVLQSWRKYTMSPEQKKRSEEMLTIAEPVIKKAFGDHLEDMLTVDTLVTHPVYQGRGYGGALLDTVAAMADAESRDTWLVSSNIINTAFYNFHGFVEVGDIILGVNNPTWKKPPVVVKAMVRHPTSVQAGLDSKA